MLWLRAEGLILPPVTRSEALPAAITFLALNGVAIPDIDVDAAEAFMLAVAKGELTEVAHIEARLIDLCGG